MAVTTFVSRRAPSPSPTTRNQIYVFDTLAEAHSGTNTGDIAVMVDTLQIRIWNGTRWATDSGGITGQTVLTDNTATGMFTVALPTVLQAVGGIIEFAVVVVDDDATDVVQIEAGITPFAAVNETGTVTATLLPSGVTLTGGAATDIVSDVGGGTNVVAFTATVSSTTVTFKVTANTSLTPEPAASFIVRWSVRLMNGTGTPPVLAAV